MIVKGVDIYSALAVLGEASLLNKTVNVLETFDLYDYISCLRDKECEDKEKIVEKEVPSKKNSKIIYGFPVVKSLFRKYTFPFKDREKIDKAVKGNLSIDLPISLLEVEYGYVIKEHATENKVDVFCVIVPKEELKYLKHSVDSEIFALLRLCRANYIHNGVLIHYGRDYIFLLKFKENFPEEVRVIKEEDAKKWINKESSVFSGFVPEYVPRDKLLLNPAKKTEYNVSYGLTLKAVDDFGVDFLHKDESKHVSAALKGAIYLVFSFLFLDISLFSYLFVKEKELRKIKEKEKEIYIKYFSASEQVYDPVLQAKGKLSLIKNGSSGSLDAADVLNEIGKAKDISGIKEIYKINISGKTFIIQGRASSIQQIEKFKNSLSIMFNASISETISTPEGDIRFVIKGEIK